jgi:hypothetical protein
MKELFYTSMERIGEYICEFNRNYSLIGEVDRASRKGIIIVGVVTIAYLGWHVWRVM